MDCAKPWPVIPLTWPDLPLLISAVMPCVALEMVEMVVVVVVVVGMVIFLVMLRKIKCFKIIQLIILNISLFYLLDIHYVVAPALILPRHLEDSPNNQVLL